MLKFVRVKLVGLRRGASLRETGRGSQCYAPARHKESRDFVASYEAQVLIPYISNGPVIFRMYPVFGVRGASWFLGVAEWLIAALLFLGFWNKKLGILGALGSCVTFVSTVTIIPFMPNGWDPAAGFPAMAGNVPFLMKDVVLLAVSIYLLKQDVVRVCFPPGAQVRSAADVVAGVSAAAANR